MLSYDFLNGLVFVFALIICFCIFFGSGMADALLPCSWGFHSGADYCSDCGAALVEWCPSCGEVIGNTKYCGHCGHALN